MVTRTIQRILVMGGRAKTFSSHMALKEQVHLAFVVCALDTVSEVNIP